MASTGAQNERAPPYMRIGDIEKLPWRTIDELESSPAIRSACSRNVARRSTIFEAEAYERDGHVYRIRYIRVMLPSVLVYVLTQLQTTLRGKAWK